MQIFKNKKSTRPLLHRGFTIVELLIVIVVIAILAAIITVAYNGITKSASISVLKSDLDGARKTLELSFVTDGSYPPNDDKLKHSEGTTLEYTRNGSTYCVSTSSTASGSSFHIDSTTGVIKEGLCSGHTGVGNGGGVVVTVLAGTGAFGFVNGPGGSAQFSYPRGIAVDNAENVYVVELGNSAIRKITPDGTVSVFAGSRDSGFVNGSSTVARFSHPNGIAIDNNGVIYVADTDNNRIRKVTQSGEVSTLAGSGVAGFASGTGVGAQFSAPSGIAVDNTRNVYVADTDNNQIRKITPSGVVSTLAGSGSAGFANGSGGSAQFDGPRNLAVDQSGNVYVADGYNNRIRKITPSGVVSTLAGSGQYGTVDGTGGAASFNNPSAIALGPNDTLYTGENGECGGECRVRTISPSGVVSTLNATANNAYQGATPGPLYIYSTGIAIGASGTLYVVNTTSNNILKITQ